LVVEAIRKTVTIIVALIRAILGTITGAFCIVFAVGIGAIEQTVAIRIDLVAAIRFGLRTRTSRRQKTFRIRAIATTVTIVVDTVRATGFVSGAISAAISIFARGVITIDSSVTIIVDPV
jgi:hypothetical protein